MMDGDIDQTQSVNARIQKQRKMHACLSLTDQVHKKMHCFSLELRFLFSEYEEVSLLVITWTMAISAVKQLTI